MKIEIAESEIRTERRPRVVIADDHPSVLVCLGRLVLISCEVVASVTNGHDALDAVSRLRPDALVVDVRMPDLDGLEVCRRVKQTLPDTDVIVVTGLLDADIEAAAFQRGASAFIRKIRAATTLEPAIQRLFAGKQDRSRTAPQCLDRL